MPLISMPPTSMTLVRMPLVRMPLASMPLASVAKPPQLVKSPPLGALLPSQGNLQFRDLFMYQYFPSILIDNIALYSHD